MGTKASHKPLETTATQALNFPAESFVSGRPPAAPGLLATSAATVIAATSAPSRRNPAREAEVGLNIYHAAAPEGVQKEVSAQKANTRTEAGLTAGEQMKDGLHAYVQQHDKRGSEFSPRAARLSTKDKEKHAKAPQSEELSEESQVAAGNAAEVTGRKPRPIGSPSSNLNRPSAAERQQ